MSSLANAKLRRKRIQAHAALELKIKGLSGADIARMYHTMPNNVGAWISQATQKIRGDIAMREQKAR